MWQLADLLGLLLLKEIIGQVGDEGQEDYCYLDQAEMKISNQLSGCM